MYLPVDEMILDLRSVLEKFQDDPSSQECLDNVMDECNRISDSCQDLWCELDGVFS